MTENEEYLYDHFLTSIKSGFLSLEDIIEETLELVEDEALQSEISEEWVKDNIKKAFETHLQKSKLWQHPTDTEKLRTAFDQLCKQHIIALHNAGYTDEEANYDIHDLWKDVEDSGIHPIGYCFYHGKSLEQVIKTNNLRIGFYGAKEKNEKEALIIGNKIVNTLKENGFEINWNNTTSKKIEIINFNWKNLYTSDEDIENEWGYDRIFNLMQ